MAIPAVIFAIALAVLGSRFTPRLSPALVAAATLLVGYVFGHSFWHANLGPLPLTLDRLMLLGVVALMAWRWRRGALDLAAPSPVDWALVGLLAWLTVSAVLHWPSDAARLPAPPYWRLAFSFWAPAMLFLVMRSSPVSQRNAVGILAMIAGLGIYLTFTAFAETAKLWPLVFPRYMADPTLGLHFGRARGPALNSVSLGIFLTAGFWAAWSLGKLAGCRVRVLLYATLPLTAMAVMLTYTRSTWLGLMASGFVVLAAELPRRLRMPVLGGLSVVGLALAACLWQTLLYLEREDSGNVSRHSVQQRTAFAYVSWKMVQDHPLVGVGFGRFYDQKLPYLSDRSQSFELESIRDLHHHNTLLSLLTETGVVGLAFYLAVLGGAGAAAWRLSQSPLAKPHERALAIFSIGVVASYLPSAVFHDLTLLHNDQWLLLIAIGGAVGCERRLAARGGAAIPITFFAMPGAPVGASARAPAT